MGGLARSARCEVWRSVKMPSADPMILICDDQEERGARACPAYAAARRRAGPPGGAPAAGDRECDLVCGPGRVRVALPAQGLPISYVESGTGGESLRYGLAGNWKESPCPSLSSRRSG